jgi:hypothetical protein
MSATVPRGIFPGFMVVASMKQSSFHFGTTMDEAAKHWHKQRPNLPENICTLAVYTSGFAHCSLSRVAIVRFHPAKVIIQWRLRPALEGRL